MPSTLIDICVAQSNVQVQLLMEYPTSTDPSTWIGTKAVTAPIRAYPNQAPSGLYLEIQCFIPFPPGVNGYVAHGVTYEGQCLFFGSLDRGQNVPGPATIALTIRAQINPVQR